MSPTAPPSTEKTDCISRREFLRVAALTAASFFVTGCNAHSQSECSETDLNLPEFVNPPEQFDQWLKENGLITIRDLNMLFSRHEWKNQEKPTSLLYTDETDAQLIAELERDIETALSFVFTQLPFVVESTTDIKLPKTPPHILLENKSIFFGLSTTPNTCIVDVNVDKCKPTGTHPSLRKKIITKTREEIDPSDGHGLTYYHSLALPGKQISSDTLMVVASTPPSNREDGLYQLEQFWHTATLSPDQARLSVLVHELSHAYLKIAYDHELSEYLEPTTYSEEDLAQIVTLVFVRDLLGIELTKTSFQ